MARTINVTKTFLPHQSEYQSILERAWKNGWITNRGELVEELELELKNYLGVVNLICMTNGTLPLQIAIKALGLKGEIITTPFSYVATTSSIVWEGCTPVYVDINPDYLTIDEGKIEEAITERTSAILATHVYGNPCNVEVIEDIAKRHNLKVIYDAAHCFGVKYKGISIFNFGDVSTCSFHATKLFHTGEGGALFCNDELYRSMYLHHNFGHDGPEIFKGIGLNAKMSELQAAMGLAVLPYVDWLIERRGIVIDHYKKQINLPSIVIRNGTEWNSSYYPVLFESTGQLEETNQFLQKNGIKARKYFYPSLDQLSYVRDANVPIASDISGRVLCLPVAHDLERDDLERIVQCIQKFT